MSNLSATPSWDDVPQIETNTPLLGGPGGPLNGPLQALLNRTEWLRGRLVSVKDPRFAGGAKGDGITNDRDAIQAALDYVALTGAVLYIPTGRYYVPNNAPTLLFTGSLTLRGDGKRKSVLAYDDDAQTGRRDFFQSNDAVDLDWEGVGFESTWGKDGNYDQRSQLVEVAFTGKARVHNCGFYKSRYMVLILSGGERAEVTGCEFEKSVADGCRLTNVRHTIVHSNTFKDINDDCIAIHTKDIAAAPMDTSISVLGNVAIDCQGMALLGGKRVNIASNTLIRPHCRGILVGPTDSTGTDGTEGNTAPIAITIVNNTILDAIHGSTFSGLSGAGDSWICLRNAPLDLVGGGYVGNSNGAGAIVQPWDYLYTNDIDAVGGVNPGSWSLNISGNTCMRTLKPVAKYSDYGFGQRYGRTGPSDPAIVIGSFLPYGVHVMEHAHDASISGNVLNGMEVPVKLGGTMSTTYTAWTNVSVAKNVISNFTDAGVSMSGSGTINLSSNIIDGDPFNVHPYRAANGKWGASYASFSAISFASGARGILTQNTFRNVGAVFQGATIDGHWWDNNIICCNPVATGYSANNIGIGDIGVPARMGVVLVEDGDPASLSYGRVLNISLRATSAMPTTGTYVRGHVVMNSTPAAVGTAGSRYVITGWSRLTTGAAHVAGTDWAEMRTLTGT